MSRRLGECVYCGTVGPITDDHIPPKSLWAPPRPTDLLSVPACRACNNGASVDDEYFKVMMVVGRDSSAHPEALRIQPSVLRALDLPAKAKFRAGLFKRMFMEDVHSPAGLYLGKAPKITVDLTRLDTVAARVVRGLYWHHHDGRRLPDSHEVTVWSESGLDRLSPDLVEELRDTVIRHCYAGPEHSRGRGVLKYWFSVDEAEPLVSAWVLRFYDTVNFLGVTAPVREQEA